MSSFISYYNAHRPKIDDGYYSDGSDSQEPPQPLLRDQTVQNRTSAETEQPKHRRRKADVQHEQEEAPETMMEETDDTNESQAFTAEQNYHGLIVRVQKSSQKHMKWKARCRRYKKKVKEQKAKKRDRKRRATEEFIDDYCPSIPNMDGFLKPYKH